MELGFLGRSGQRGGGGFAPGDDFGDLIEVSGADFMLMFGRGVSS